MSRDGIVYITFDDNGVIDTAEDIIDAPKIEKKKEAGSEDKLSEVGEREDSLVSECVYEPEEEYG